MKNCRRLPFCQKRRRCNFSRSQSPMGNNMENTFSVLETFKNINNQLQFAERKNTYIFSFFSLVVVLTPFLYENMADRLIMGVGLMRMSLTIFYILYIVSIFIAYRAFFGYLCRRNRLKNQISILNKIHLTA